MGGALQRARHPVAEVPQAGGVVAGGGVGEYHRQRCDALGGSGEKARHHRRINGDLHRPGLIVVGGEILQPTGGGHHRRVGQEAGVGDAGGDDQRDGHRRVDGDVGDGAGDNRRAGGPGTITIGGNGGESGGVAEGVHDGGGDGFGWATVGDDKGVSDPLSGDDAVPGGDLTQGQVGVGHTLNPDVYRAVEVVVEIPINHPHRVDHGLVGHSAGKGPGRLNGDGQSGRRVRLDERQLADNVVAAAPALRGQDQIAHSRGRVDSVGEDRAHRHILVVGYGQSEGDPLTGRDDIGAAHLGEPQIGGLALVGVRHHLYVTHRRSLEGG